MELRWANMFFNFSRHRRRWLFAASAIGATGYSAYKIYHLPAVDRKRRKVVGFLRALCALIHSLSSSAEAVSLVSSDLGLYLRSDSDEMPASLRQISKLSRSEDFLSSLTSLSEAVTRGIVRGFQTDPDSPEEAKGKRFSDRFLDRLFSPAGNGIASVLAGSLVRNLITAYYSERPHNPNEVPRWFRLLCGDKGKEAAALWVQVFASTAVATYLEKKLPARTYDDILSRLTNPKHEAQVKDLLVSLCNASVETLVKTSHQVMTAPKKTTAVVGAIHREDRSNGDVAIGIKDSNGGGWVGRVSSTLSTPTNRRLVLDVTGRVTAETVRSFLDFLLQKFSDGARKGMTVAREEVVERALEVVKYVSIKPMAAFAVCFALIMQVSVATRLLIPAGFIKT